jgi:hypothetical protein
VDSDAVATSEAAVLTIVSGLQSAVRQFRADPSSGNLPCHAHDSLASPSHVSIRFPVNREILLRFAIPATLPSLFRTTERIEARQILADA